jgi:hypothetical protein
MPKEAIIMPNIGIPPLLLIYNPRLPEENSELFEDRILHSQASQKISELLKRNSGAYRTIQIPFQVIYNNK